MYCLLVEEEEDFSWRRRRRTREEILRSDQGRELAKLFIALARQVGGDPRPRLDAADEAAQQRERREAAGQRALEQVEAQVGDAHVGERERPCEPHAAAQLEQPRRCRCCRGRRRSSLTTRRRGTVEGEGRVRVFRLAHEGTCACAQLFSAVFGVFVALVFARCSEYTDALFPPRLCCLHDTGAK